MKMKMRLSVMLLACCFTLIACGGNPEVKKEITTTTKGQQLIDLQKALESGAINPTEYERERKRILAK